MRRPARLILGGAAAGSLVFLAACRDHTSASGEGRPPPKPCAAGFQISDTEISYNLMFRAGRIVDASRRAVKIVTGHGGRILEGPRPWDPEEAVLQAVVPSTAAAAAARAIAAGGRIMNYHEQRRNHPDDIWCLEDRLDKARQARVAHKPIPKPAGPWEPDFETMLRWKTNLEAAPGRAHLQIIIGGPRYRDMSEALAKGWAPLQTPGVDRSYMLWLEVKDKGHAMRRAETLLFARGAMRRYSSDKFRGRGGRQLYTAKYLMPAVEAERSLPRLRALGTVDQFDLVYLRDPSVLKELDRRIGQTPRGPIRAALERRRAFHAKGSGWVEVSLSMYSLQ